MAPAAKPNTNPCGLSAREIEIAVLAWKSVDADGKASSPTTPTKTTTQHHHTHEYITSYTGQGEQENERNAKENPDHHQHHLPTHVPTTPPNKTTLLAHDLPITDTSLLVRPAKQVNKQKLAEVTRIPLPQSAARMWRGIKAKIDKNDVGAPATAPATPGNPCTPVTPDTKSSAVVAASDPTSPSLVASMKKKKKAAFTPVAGCGGGGKVKGRKRALEEVDGGDENGWSGDGAGERPKKIPKSSKQRNKPSAPKVMKELGSVVDEMEAREV